MNPILAILLIAIANAVPVTFSVDPKPTEQVTRTDIFKVSKTGERTFVATSSSNVIAADLPAGTYTFTAASQNVKVMASPLAGATVETEVEP